MKARTVETVCWIALKLFVLYVLVYRCDLSSFETVSDFKNAVSCLGCVIGAIVHRIVYNICQIIIDSTYSNFEQIV